MTDWQPIETAPKDGTNIIIGDPHSESLVVYWLNLNGLATWRDWDTDPHPDATHWMPLPDPPVQP